MRSKTCLMCQERTPDSEMNSRGLCLCCTENWDELDEDEKWDFSQNFLLPEPPKREGLVTVMLVASLLLVVMSCP